MTDRSGRTSWERALRELRAASREYDECTSDLGTEGLGEGTEALAWLRLRRAVDEYQQARDNFVRGLVIDQ